MEDQPKEQYIEKTNLEKDEIPSDTMMKGQGKENLEKGSENNINKENNNVITSQEKEINKNDEENNEEPNDEELNEMEDNIQEEKELNKQIQQQEEIDQEIEEEKEEEKEEHVQEKEGEDIIENNENVEEIEQEQIEIIQEEQEEENQQNNEGEYYQQNQPEEEYKERKGIHIHTQTEENAEKNENQEENIEEEDTGKIHPVEQDETDINQNEEKIEYKDFQQIVEVEEENQENGEIIEKQEGNQQENENYEDDTQENKYPQPLDNKKKINNHKAKRTIEQNKHIDNVREIPRLMIFKKSKGEGEKIESNYKLKRNDYKYFVEIPKDEMKLYEKKEIIVLKGGMETGEYRFLGSETKLAEEVPIAKVTITKEEILNEINRRSNKKKKISYEVTDKYYSLTVYEDQNTKVKIPKKEKEENNEEEDLKMPKDNFSKYLLEQINKIRADPQSFIGVIEDAKDNIKKRKSGKYYYNGNKIKVALIEGESAFNEALDFLKSCQPMEPLTFSQTLIPPPPQSEEEIEDKNYLKKCVEKMLINGITINSYWRDVINDAEICFLLMIVDDNGIKKGMRRNDILNPDIKEIGISSVEINGQLVNYFVLS